MKLLELIRCPVCNRAYGGSFWVRKIVKWSRDCLGWIVGNRGGDIRKKDHGFYVHETLRLRKDVSPEAFNAVKSRLLGATKQWFSLGWLTIQDIRGLFESLASERILEWVDPVWIVECDRRPGFRPVKSDFKLVDVAPNLRKPMSRSCDQVEVC